jgi:hypothetical protein
MTGQQLRSKRVLARIPGYMVCQRTGISSGKLSQIECGLSGASPEELSRIDEALNNLIEAKRKVSQTAAKVGWPVAAL